ncbi:MAG: aminotransferase class I/II-fold pyridoxal phosphate-dependent enzyme [Oscillospiraceae bacterium]|nr:aminotransferase class I/II-fold pyridoxal phosphate-dependent enzyme [Oscillospiraceae bacterium]
MKYNFTDIIERQGKDSIAVDGFKGFPAFSPKKPKEGFSLIPMWVADMNFATVPTIAEAITERAKHPLFGYFEATDEYFDSIINWHEKRNGVKGIKKEHIGYENSVLGGVMSTINSLAAPGDALLLHTPVYSGFTNIIGMNGYKMVFSPLKKDENNVWRMDFEDMDRKIKENNIHVAVFCNPHNPCGRVWEKWELEKALEVYKANDVTVISDEIWSDIILDGHKHTPMQSVNEWAKENVVAFYAPSKTFNLGGLIGAYNIIYNKRLRDQIKAKGAKTHYNEMNVLWMHALIGAYKPEGHEWTDELCQVLTENINYGYNYIKEHFEGVEVIKPEGTYMLWLDCTEWLEKHNMTQEELLNKGWDVGVTWQSGVWFEGPSCIRMNLALPMSKIVEAFERMDKYVFNA